MPLRETYCGKIFFTNAGADAIENAIRLARLHTGRDKVISGYRSYHGNTGAAIVATGDWRRVPNEYSRGHAHFCGPFEYRTEFWSDSPEQEVERALQHLERTIQGEGPNSIAAILIETVFSWPGTGFLLGNAIFQRDLPLLQGAILVLAMFFVALNVLVDIVQGLIDPRVRRQ